MPSLRHEVLRVLFENRPALAAELLDRVFHVSLPAFSTVHVQPSDLTQAVPIEYRADAVVVLQNSTPVLSVIVEIQLRRVATKKWVWPVYAAVERARNRCPVVVLIVAGDESVARWAAQPIALGPPENWFRVLVLGPAGIPPMVQDAEVRRCPELAVLSAIAHGRSNAWGLKRARQIVDALGTLDEEKRALYTDLIVMSLADGVRANLEAMMLHGYEYQTRLPKRISLKA